MRDAEQAQSAATAMRTGQSDHVKSWMTGDMIASNTYIGVAPDPGQITVIDEVYAFAARLRD